MKLSLFVFILTIFSYSQAFGVDLTYKTYETICESQGLPMSASTSKDICNIVVKNEVCANVPKDQLLKCDELGSIGITDYWDYTLGCTNGVFNFIGDTIGFIWEVMKWAGLNAVSSDARSETADATSEFMNSSKLFLLSEYEKARAEAKPPLQEAKALYQMGNSIGKLIYDQVSAQVSSQYQEMGCLNAWARNEKICQVYSEIFIPPAAVLAFLKRGSQAAEEFSNLKILLNKPEVPKSNVLLETYPNLGKTYANIGKGISTAKRITDPSQIPFEKSAVFRSINAYVMRERAKVLEPELKNSIMAAYNTLNDPKILKNYYQGLFKEAAEWMEKKGKPEDLQLLKQGKVNLHAITVVVVQRLKNRGDDRFTTMKKGKLSFGKAAIKMENENDVNEPFRNAIKGPFFDRSFLDNDPKGHGSVSHLIQRDIVHDSISKETNGNPQRFYDFLATKKGVNWWLDLFDSGDFDSMTKAENVTKYIHDKMLPLESYDY